MAQLKSEDLMLDNNQFLIYNKMYPHAKLTLLKDVSVGTTELALAPEQLWTFKPSENIKGCYYIINEAHPELRLADWKNKLIAYDDKHYGDQVFKLVPSGNDDGHFYIYSQCYERDIRIQPGRSSVSTRREREQRAMCALPRS